jgi:long-subunit acyl-CoA synthetase (AMP-forming)
MTDKDRHLCVLPLATLLENIAGVYVPLLAGAQCIVLPMQEIGLRGASGFDDSQLHRSLVETGASTMVLVPHLLQQLVEHYEQLPVVNTSLRFVAVGGAPVSPELLERALECGLPVYEGYGLSECASVVSVNHHPHHRPGSVGKPLPHTNIKFANDGEILLKGALFTGYLGQTPGQSDYLATGDIGYLDEDGYLYITGRKKNMFITAFGRNVSPDWIERELVLEPAIQQAAVFGEGRAWNVALIVRASNSTDAEINQAIEKVNENLPDYARVKTWLAASEPFSLVNQQLTATGRLRRNEIWKKYTGLIEDLYITNTDPHRKSA